MKPAETLKFAAKLRIALHPDIHPDDAEKALRALFWRAAKARKKPTPESILEDLFIRSVAPHPTDQHFPTSERPLTEDQKKAIVRLLADKDFCEKLARAMYEGRARLFDSVDTFILRNWRLLTVLKFSETLPGLQDWHPRAARELIVSLELSPPRDDDAWYIQRRKRLGQSGKRRYRVQDFRALAGNEFEVKAVRD